MGDRAAQVSEQFAYLMPFERHVTLGFYHGGDLPDPAGLLPATGGRQVSGELAMRSTRITRPEQIGEPALRELIQPPVTDQVARVREPGVIRCRPIGKSGGDVPRREARGGTGQ